MFGIRSHRQTREQVEARIADYVNGDMTEDVLRASLKALGLDMNDSNIEVFKAKNELLRTHHEYLKANKRGGAARSAATNASKPIKKGGPHGRRW